MARGDGRPRSFIQARPVEGFRNHQARPIRSFSPIPPCRFAPVGVFPNLPRRRWLLRSAFAVVSFVQIVGQRFASVLVFGSGFRSVCAVVSLVQIAGPRLVLVLAFWRWFWSFCSRGASVRPNFRLACGVGIGLSALVLVVLYVRGSVPFVPWIGA